MSHLLWAWIARFDCICNHSQRVRNRGATQEKVAMCGIVVDGRGSVLLPSHVFQDSTTTTTVVVSSLQQYYYSTSMAIEPCLLAVLIRVRVMLIRIFSPHFVHKLSINRTCANQALQTLSRYTRRG